MFGDDTLFESQMRDFEAIENGENKNVDEQMHEAGTVEDFLEVFDEGGMTITSGMRSDYYYFNGIEDAVAAYTNEIDDYDVSAEFVKDLINYYEEKGLTKEADQVRRFGERYMEESKTKANEKREGEAFKEKVDKADEKSHRKVKEDNDLWGAIVDVIKKSDSKWEYVINLVSQVWNGGFQQWIDNGYAAEEGMVAIKLLTALDTDAAKEMANLAQEAIASEYMELHKSSREEQDRLEPEEWEDIAEPLSPLDDKFYDGLDDRLINDIAARLNVSDFSKDKEKGEPMTAGTDSSFENLVDKFSQVEEDGNKNDVGDVEVGQVSQNCPRCGCELGPDMRGQPYCKECDWHQGDPEEVEEKKAVPACSKCSKKHWPFQKCGSKVKEGRVKESVEQVIANVVSDTYADRLTEICDELGMEPEDVLQALTDSYEVDLSQGGDMGSLDEWLSDNLDASTIRDNIPDPLEFPQPAPKDTGDYFTGEESKTNEDAKNDWAVFITKPMKKRISTWLPELKCKEFAKLLTGVETSKAMSREDAVAAGSKVDEDSVEDYIPTEEDEEVPTEDEEVKGEEVAEVSDVDFRPLEVELEKMLGIPVPLTGNLERGRHGNPRISFSSENLVEHAGIFKAALKEVFVQSFSGGKVNKEGTIWWSVVLSFEVKRGGHNGVDIMRGAWYDTNSGEWTFEAA